MTTINRALLGDSEDLLPPLAFTTPTPAQPAPAQSPAQPPVQARLPSPGAFLPTMAERPR